MITLIICYMCGEIHGRYESKTTNESKMDGKQCTHNQKENKNGIYGKARLCARCHLNGDAAITVRLGRVKKIMSYHSVDRWDLVYA